MEIRITNPNKKRILIGIGFQYPVVKSKIAVITIKNKVVIIE